MTAGAGANAGGSDGPDTVRVVSPDRRVPLSAQLELEEYGIIHSEQPGGEGPAEILHLQRRPPDALLEKHGLRVGTSAQELWRDPDGRLIEIHTDRVVIDGVGTDIDPAEARDHVREAGYESVAVPEDADPDGE